jgi:hypothetical protein
LKNKAVKAFVLTAYGKKPLKMSQEDQGITIDLTSVVQDRIATVVGLEVKGQTLDKVVIN